MMFTFTIFTPYGSLALLNASRNSLVSRRVKLLTSSELIWRTIARKVFCQDAPEDTACQDEHGNQQGNIANAVLPPGQHDNRRAAAGVWADKGISRLVQRDAYRGQLCIIRCHCTTRLVDSHREMPPLFFAHNHSTHMIGMCVVERSQCCKPSSSSAQGRRRDLFTWLALSPWAENIIIHNIDRETNGHVEHQDDSAEDPFCHPKCWMPGERCTGNAAPILCGPILVFA